MDAADYSEERSCGQCPGGQEAKVARFHVTGRGRGPSVRQVCGRDVKDLRSAGIGSLCDTPDSWSCLASIPDQGWAFIERTWDLGPRGGELDGTDGSGRPITCGGMVKRI